MTPVDLFLELEEIQLTALAALQQIPLKVAFICVLRDQFESCVERTSYALLITPEDALPRLGKRGTYFRIEKITMAAIS